MLNKLKQYQASLSIMALGLMAFVIAPFASASPSSTPEEVMDTLVGGTIDAAVDTGSMVITNYLKYLLVLGVVVGLYYAFKKFARIGSR
jgi:type IV secretory pathway VirB2 component (pilin)